MGPLKVVGAAGLLLSALGAFPTEAAEFGVPVFDGVIRPITTPFRIEVQPGWQAQCVSRIDELAIEIDKTTTNDDGVILSAHVNNSRRSVSAVEVFGVQVFFTREGAAADVQIEEIAGHPISDETFHNLRSVATSIVPEAEFAGRMSDEIDDESVAPSSAQRGVDIALRLAVEGTTSSEGEEYVFIRRSGLMSGSLEGQHVSIRFEGYTRLHRASGLVAEQVLNTELRTDSANPRREESRLSCEITRSG